MIGAPTATWRRVARRPEVTPTLPLPLALTPSPTLTPTLTPSPTLSPTLTLAEDESVADSGSVTGESVEGDEDGEVLGQGGWTPVVDLEKSFDEFEVREAGL